MNILQYIIIITDFNYNNIYILTYLWLEEKAALTSAPPTQ